MADAAIESVTLTGIALALGILLSLAWALAAHLYRSVGHIVSSVMLIAQSVPLLALAPLFVLLFGRGIVVTLIIAVLAIIFPGFAVIAQRLDTIPEPLYAIGDLYARSKIQRVRSIDVPWAAYGIFTALRVSAPRALLGVMLAEYLATGRGLGFLMATARGQLDFTTVWTGVVATAIVALGFHYIATALERWGTPSRRRDRFPRRRRYRNPSVIEGLRDGTR